LPATTERKQAGAKQQESIFSGERFHREHPL
jgi:hypothetical protein